jgi:hypothetical protein
MFSMVKPAAVKLSPRTGLSSPALAILMRLSSGKVRKGSFV